ncbi:unnamed protein product [Mytilus coruscus]|uniref:non-specific serine/threonine protein kinase n=1 Tax=Mytilus coruscus TaxID=42192 RepID=A0A6J8BU73_MYTCO|nr:unnamed protein product [Mytilus coruscus]
MDLFILLTALQILSLNEAYNFTCPSQAHWNIRAKSMCDPPRNYTCLFNVTFRVNVYRDICNRPRILGHGYKYVFQPNLNRATCSVTRYQPFIFDTIGHSDCIYQKSLCNSLGQDTYEHGNTTVDRKCTCNTDRGYTFVRNSKKQCYCNPSTEDCSCYLGINPYDKTIGLKDIKCYDDMKKTRNPYLGNTFNNSRTITIIEFDNFKYNLKYHAIAVCIIVHRIMPRWIKFHNKIQIQHTTSLDVTNMNEHIAAIKDGTEIRRYVRIQVIGKAGVGKSSLIRTLVGDFNTKLNSTDGIDIVKKCQIRTTDGEWVIGKVETERKKIMKRIQEAVYKEQKKSELVSHEVIPYKTDNSRREAISCEEPLSEVEGKQENQPQTKHEIRIASSDSIAVDKNETNEVDNIPSISIDKSLTGENKVNIGDTVTMVAEKSNIDKPNKKIGVLSKDDQKSEDSVKSDDMRKKITEQMNAILAEVKKDQDRMTSESLVECGLWDFAGQKDYYATHQTFLNPHAIYLLVANISEDIAATEEDKNFDSIEEYIDFWFDSIHCLRTSSTGHRLYPPVIVVCTHIDEYKTEKEVEERKTKYIERFKEIFGGQDKANHNRGIYFLSNTQFLKRESRKLKEKISEVAKEMNFFAEELPTQWIQLENALGVLKDSKQNILSWQNLVELAQTTFIKKEELLPFLTYQHKIGNIIFFADLKDYIILQPDWLVKCFRCQVCDNHPHKRNIEIVQLTDWHNLEKTGQLSDRIIDRLFEKEPDLEFGKYKTHILNVMEKFDIIVKPQFIAANNDSSLIQNSYYMPCMITNQSTSLDIIQKSFKGEKISFSSSPWLVLEFKFLPLVYFNHILFYYITKYTVCEETDGQKSLSRGKALVNLDKTGLRKLCICFSKNVIALQVWKLADVEFSRYDTILEELCRNIEELKTKLRQSIYYDIKAKCRNGDYSNRHSRMTYKELGEMCENGHYLCLEHKEMHSKDDAENTWLRHADTVTAKLNKEQDERMKGSTFSIEAVYTQAHIPRKLSLEFDVELKQKFQIEKLGDGLLLLDCATVNNQFIFTDNCDKRLVVHNSDGSYYQDIKLSDKPLCISAIIDNDVVVTFKTPNMQIININTGQVKKVIKTNGQKCLWVSYRNGLLYANIDKKKIDVMNQTGRLINSFNCPSSVWYIATAASRLVMIDPSQDALFCCDLQGSVLWKFTDQKIKRPYNVTTDGNGNTYVVCTLSHNVVVVSSDGKYHKEIEIQKDDLRDPTGIHYDKSGNSLLVFNRTSGKVLLFKINHSK